MDEPAGYDYRNGVTVQPGPVGLYSGGFLRGGDEMG